MATLGRNRSDRDRGADETRIGRTLAKFHFRKVILVYRVDKSDRGPWVAQFGVGSPRMVNTSR